MSNGLVRRLDVYTLRVSFRGQGLRISDNFGQSVLLETKNENELLDLFQAFDLFGCQSFAGFCTAVGVRAGPGDAQAH